MKIVMEEVRNKKDMAKKNQKMSSPAYQLH